MLRLKKMSATNLKDPNVNSTTKDQLKHLGITGLPTPVLVIKNVHSLVGEKDIRVAFGKAGKIKRIEVNTESRGRFAIVEYELLNDAIDAFVKFQTTFLFGQRIMVTMVQANLPSDPQVLSAVPTTSAAVTSVTTSGEVTPGTNSYPAQNSNHYCSLCKVSFSKKEQYESHLLSLMHSQRIATPSDQDHGQSKTKEKDYKSVVSNTKPVTATQTPTSSSLHSTTSHQVSSLPTSSASITARCAPSSQFNLPPKSALSMQPTSQSHPSAPSMYGPRQPRPLVSTSLTKMVPFSDISHSAQVQVTSRSAVSAHQSLAPRLPAVVRAVTTKPSPPPGKSLAPNTTISSDNIFCSVCNVTFTLQDRYYSHLRGLMHSQRLMASQEGTFNPTSNAPTVVQMGQTTSSAPLNKSLIRPSSRTGADLANYDEHRLSDYSRPAPPVLGRQQDYHNRRQWMTNQRQFNETPSSDSRLPGYSLTQSFDYGYDRNPNSRSLVRETSHQSQFKLDKRRTFAESKAQPSTFNKPPSQKEDNELDETRCNLCNVDFINKNAYIQHMRSVGHMQNLINNKKAEGALPIEEGASDDWKLKVQAIKDNSTVNPIRDQIDQRKLGLKDMEEAPQFYCELCSVPCTSQENYYSHLLGFKHKRDDALNSLSTFLSAYNLFKLFNVR